MAQALETIGSQLDGLDPYSQLARYVQESPGRINDSASDLAQRFGLPVEFVIEVQQTLGEHQEPVDSWQAFVGAGRAVCSFIAGLWKFLADGPVKLWLRVTALPLRFVLVTGLLFLIAFFVTVPYQVLRTGPVLDGAIGVLFIIVFATHLACFARHGEIRVPLVAAAALAPGLFAIGLVIPPPQGSERPPLLVIAAIAMGLTALYALASTAASVLGGIFRLRLAYRRESQVSRQEQLDRLFQLEKRFREIVQNQRAVPWAVSWVTSVRRWAGYPLVAFLAGAGYGLLRVLLVGSVQAVRPNGSTVLTMLQMLMVPLGLAVFATVGYLAGGIRKSIVALLVAFSGWALSLSVPIGRFGPEYVYHFFRAGDALVVISALTLLGVLTGLASKVEAQTARATKLDKNDPVALFAETLRLQWKLRPASLATCVMVVDVVRSTAMKSEADPLKIEYSFRAYQDLVAEVSQERGGTVVSTAGDGAVVTFGSPEDALRAAKSIQSAMDSFNLTKNLLGHRFRVRIGLHSGKTSVGLEEVPFNELIDIAAHVEHISPAGGIALTDSVASALPDEATAALQELVDGHEVRIVLNPLLED